LTLSGTVTSSGNLTLGGSLSAVNLTSQVTGTLPVANGGTGATTLTSNNVILGNGTSAVNFVAPGASGNVLTSNGTTWTSAAAGGGGGACEHITTVTVGAGASTIDIFWAATYDHVRLVLTAVRYARLTASNPISLQLSTDGSAFKTGASDYAYQYIASNTSNARFSGSSASTSSIFTGAGYTNQTFAGMNGIIDCYCGTQTNTYPGIVWQLWGYYGASTTFQTGLGGAVVKFANNRLRGIKIIDFGSTTNQGLIEVYGFKD